MFRSTRWFTLAALFLIPTAVLAQVQQDVVPLKSWPAPLYWQPPRAESGAATRADTSFNVAIDATTPANALVFVGMTPCRVVDTRNGSGFTGFFGPPALAAGVFRTFPIQSSPNCSIPAIAQAYSFNITVVPPGFLDYITVWPTGAPQPNASTLNGYVNTVIANAAIVPAGTSGQVNLYASQNTHLIIDINGYYAAQSGITLAQGTAGGPSLSFLGDPGTGIFSSGPGTLNLTTGGTNRVQLSNGNVNVTGNLNVNGVPEGVRIQGPGTEEANTAFATFVDSAGTRIGYVGDGSEFDKSIALDSDQGDVVLRTAAGRVLTATPSGNVGIGSTTPLSQLHVSSSNTGSTSLVLENIANGASRQVILSNYGSTGGGLYWPGLNSANTSSLLGPDLFVLRGTGGLAFSGSSTAEHMRIAPDGRTSIGGLALANSKLNVSHFDSNGCANGCIGVSATVSPGCTVCAAFSGTAASGFGVNGSATQGYGVSGTTNDGVGVYGSNNNSNTTGYAGFFGGRVHITGNLVVDGVFSNPSDARLKQGLHPLGYGLAELRQLRPVTWKWKAEPEGRLQLGLIAQEVETVLPELVSTDNDAEHTKGLNYIGLVPLLIKGIQEQQLQIEAQQAQLTREQEQNRKLEERLAAIEAMLSAKIPSAER